LQVVPVIDLKGGLAVHARAGERAQYRPVSPEIAPAGCPVELARWYLAQFGPRPLYLADLDAIAGSPPAASVYAEIQALGGPLWVDAGVATFEQAAAVGRRLFAHGEGAVIVGLETLGGEDALSSSLKEFGPKRVIFSLDLREGRPLGGADAWRGSSPLEIAARCHELGVRRMILLDLARVGTRKGAAGDPLWQLVAGVAGVEWSVGGGVAGAEELVELGRQGASHVLAATALHAGRITPDGLRQAEAQFR